MLPTSVVRGKANPLHFKFPDRLRKLRKAAGLSGSELSRRAGINRDAAVHLEAGRWVPRLDTVERLANILQVSAGWLAYGIEGEWAAAEQLRCAAVGVRVQAAREAAGLTLTEVGRRAGSSAAAVLTVERRGVTPTLGTAENLAKALGVSLAWLAFGEGPMELRKRRYPQRGTGQHQPAAQLDQLGRHEVERVRQ